MKLINEDNQRIQKNLNINCATIYDRTKMPAFDECQKIVNPQGLPLEALSQSERIFLEFCELYDSYPEEIKEAIKQW
ncbi:conserved lipothrixviral protein [Sulfolobus islandicus filamentous virus 2]|uniref:Conserved lipothrixviral protein n=1 Tax=Sulfolobus islandicus filamentous virus 2 TaxID=1902331 RepID=A0A1D8BJ69_SIFV|nr:conserved lipothrixviral protein [Sulfolobus islandicus filamentous virus 2]